MEYISCNLCGSTDAKYLLKGKDRTKDDPTTYTLVKCSCGLMYINPQPTPSEQQSHYDPDYAPYVPNYQVFEQGLLFRTLKRTRDSFKKKPIPAVKSGIVSNESVIEDRKKVLDFGCGKGYRIELLRKQHPQWEVFGYDVATNKTQDPNIIIGTLEDLKRRVPPASLNRIYMGNVLEHLTDPLKILQELSELLVSGGELYIDVPNIDSIKFKVFRQNFSSLDLPRHLYHFTDSTLSALCEKAGFTIKSLKKSGTAKSTLRSIYYTLGIKREKLSATGIFLVTRLTKLFGNTWDEDELNLVAVKSK